MKYLLYSLLRWFIIFLASSIVFFALIVIVGRVLTPYFSRQAQAVAHFSGNLLKKPVQINQFLVVWQGLTPVLEGKQVIIWDDSRSHPLLQIKQLNVGINLFTTLLTGHIKLGEISISGIKLLVRRTRNGQFDVAGVSSLFKQSSKDHMEGLNEVLGWLFAEPQLSLQDISLTYYPQSGPSWPIMQISGILQNQGDHHWLSGKLQLLEEKPSVLSFSADLTGSLMQWPLLSLSGRVYCEGQHVLLDRWVKLLQQEYVVQNGFSHFKAWADWKQDHLTRIQILFSNPQPFSLQIDKQPTLYLMPFFAHILWELTAHDSWTVDAIVQQFGFLPWKKIPGIKGLNAYWHITPLAGNVIARSSDLTVDFMKLFKAPIHLDSLSCQSNWQHQGNDLLIQIPQFKAFNQDVSVNAQMGLFIPDRKRDPQMSLLAHIKTDHVSRIGYYLPQTLLSPHLIHWLNEAIVKGSSIGSVLLQGPISQFPFDKNEGTFLIDSQIKKGELNYEPGWPSLRRIDGELIFSGRQMHMLADSAQIFGTTLRDIKADIPMMKKHVQALLYIAITTIDTSLEKGLLFLAATPLAKSVASQLSSLVLSGPLQLSLQLSIPLESGKEKLKVVGEASTQNAKVEIPSHAIQLDHLGGQFSFTQEGIRAQKLMASLWGKPIAIAIQAVPTTQLTIHYNGFQTDLKPEKEGWRFTVDNKAAKGNIFIPNNKQQTVEANFDFLDLNAVISSSQTDQWNMKQIPKVNLNAKEVRYKNINFGAVQLKLSPMLGGVLIRALRAGNTNYHLVASGAWHTRNPKLTQLIGQLDSAKLSDFLRSWGLPASITAQQAHIRFRLQWPDVPSHISLSKLSGQFSFDASNGQIVDIGSSAEAKLSFGRLLTFLSIQSLSRRLQLDFSDLKGKGFDFNTLQGRFTLSNGNALTRDVTIEGPVAAIAMLGRIGLLSKDYDLTIKIVPHFTSSLPVIVGLAGGPVAGVITWVANALLGSTVQKIAATSYHITGLWGKPEIVKTST